MTYCYGDDNEKKRGPRWLLTHCALCGDPHQVIPWEMNAICRCTAELQRSRRYVREEFPKRDEARRQREREAMERAHPLRSTGSTTP